MGLMPASRHTLLTGWGGCEGLSGGRGDKWRSFLTLMSMTMGDGGKHRSGGALLSGGQWGGGSAGGVEAARGTKRAGEEERNRRGFRGRSDRLPLGRYSNVDGSHGRSRREVLGPLKRGMARGGGCGRKSLRAGGC